jgi:predicted nucleic acid-binding protein
MSHCVLDSSAALAWVLPGEGSETADQLLERIVTEGAVVPGLWPLEIANVLLMAERRGRITISERHQALATLAELPIHIEPSTAARAWTATLALAESHKLTVYDATYLEAAIRLTLPLASYDRNLRQAATACGVTILC